MSAIVFHFPHFLVVIGLAYVLSRLITRVWYENGTGHCDIKVFCR